MAYFTQDFIDFFKELRENNNKAWFDENRKRYEKSVKKPFFDFVEQMIVRVHTIDSDVTISAKEAIFRINRDIRFAKDKTPYKTNCSAIISATGRSDKTFPGVYFEFNPDELRLYGGAHMLESAALSHLRNYFAENSDYVKSVLADKNFVKYFGEIKGEQNKRLPADLQQAANDFPLILNKQYYYFAKLDSAHLLQDDLPEVLMTYFKAGEPVKQMLLKALGKEG